MASIAIMVGVAVLNAATFIGGNYLARYLSGDDPKAAQEEKVRHDKALEAQMDEDGRTAFKVIGKELLP